MNSGRSVLLLLFLNIFLLIGIFFLLDWLGVLPTIDFAKETLGFTEEVSVTKTEYPTLLKKEELKKFSERLSAKEQILNAKEEALKEYQKDIEKLKQQIITKANEIEQKEQRLEERIRLANDRQQNIEKLAKSISNMSPDTSVEIIKGLDDKMMIDIFREMNRQAAVEDQTSIVDLLIQKLPYKVEDGKKVIDEKGLKKARAYYKLQAQFPGEAKE